MDPSSMHQQGGMRSSSLFQQSLSDGKGQALRHSAVVHPSATSAYRFELDANANAKRNAEGYFFPNGRDSVGAAFAEENKRLFFSPAYFEPELLKVTFKLDLIIKVFD